MKRKVLGLSYALMDPLWTPYGPLMDPLWTSYGPLLVMCLSQNNRPVMARAVVQVVNQLDQWDYVANRWPSELTPNSLYWVLIVL